MHTLRRNSPRALIALSTLILSGCFAIPTPDGHTLTSFTGPAGVRGMLGEPDMIESGDYRQIGRHTATNFTYLDRGYNVHLVDDRVVSVVTIPEVQRHFIKGRVRAYKEKMTGGEAGDQTPSK